MLKKYILPILLGCVAGTFIIWVFDSFEAPNLKYFAKAFLKSLVPVSIAVFVVNSRQKNSLQKNPPAFKSRGHDYKMNL